MDIASQLEIHAKQELDHALTLSRQIDYLGKMPAVTPKPVRTSEKAKDKIGSYAFWGFIVLLLLAYAGATFGPPPPSVNKMAIGTLFTWLLIPWAWWFDRHREVREVVPRPSKQKIIHAGG